MLTVAYMGGGGYQKWPKSCFSNLWTALNDSSDSNDFSMYSLYLGNIFIPLSSLKAYKKLDNLHLSL